jgi:hypothetical protein
MQVLYLARVLFLTHKPYSDKPTQALKGYAVENLAGGLKTETVAREVKLEIPANTLLTCRHCDIALADFSLWRGMCKPNSHL